MARLHTQAFLGASLAHAIVRSSCEPAAPSAGIGLTAQARGASDGGAHYDSTSSSARAHNLRVQSLPSVGTAAIQYQTGTRRLVRAVGEAFRSSGRGGTGYDAPVRLSAHVARHGTGWIVGSAHRGAFDNELSGPRHDGYAPFRTRPAQCPFRDDICVERRVDAPCALEVCARATAHWACERATGDCRWRARRCKGVPDATAVARQRHCPWQPRTSCEAR